MNEGVIWEALMTASHYGLTNLIPIVDRNRMMIDGPTEEVMGLEPLEEKLESFGFEVLSVDGHDFNALAGAMDRAIEVQMADGSRPVFIVANTIKGKGVDFMENQVAWHYGSIDAELRDKALASLDRAYAEQEDAVHE